MSNPTGTATTSESIEQRVKEVRFTTAVSMGSDGKGKSVSRLVLQVPDQTITNRPDTLRSIRIIGPGIVLTSERGEFMVPWGRVDSIELMSAEDFKAREDAKAKGKAA